MTTITITTNTFLGATYEFYTGQGNYSTVSTGPTTWDYTSTFTAAGNNTDINSASNVVGIAMTSSVTSIGNGAFYFCSNLTGAFTIPDGVVTIGDNAFLNTNFTSFAIGSGVTTIGILAFASNSLTTITVPSSAYFTASSNILYTFGETELVYCPKLKNVGSFTVPNVTTKIRDNAFDYNIYLTAVTTGSGLITISSCAFRGCSFLATFTNNSTVLTTIGSSAFEENKFVSFVIPNSVTSIGNNAFASCISLTSLTIGTGVTLIGMYAVSNCTSLSTITNNATTLANLGDGCFSGCPITTFTIPNTVTIMGSNVFDTCNSLTSLTIGSSVPSLINFGSMTALQNYVVAGGSNYSAIDGVLYNIAAGAYELISVPQATATTNLIVPSGVLTISNVSNSSLTSISFPTSVTNIGYYACYNNSLLTSITFADGSNPVTAAPSFPTNILLTDITIPSSFINLLPSDFGGCTKLENSTPVGPGPTYEGTLHTDALPGDYVYDLFLPAGTNSFYVNYVYTGSPVCFREGSKILRVNSETGNEEYIVIQDLRKGDLIKTVSSGLKKIEHIGYSKMYNNVNAIRSNDKLYRCSTSEYKELTEDLIITGCHSILIKNFKDQEQIEKTQEVLGKIFITEKHYRLPACVDERTKIFEEEGVHTIWHFSLEHSDYYMNYGVYANGLLVETTSHRMMLELSGMTLV